MKKQQVKVSDFKLPLLEQKVKFLNQLPKSNSKRSRFDLNQSNLNTKRKQKDLNKPSNLRREHQEADRANLLQKDHKSKSTTKPDNIFDDDIDFQNKIKENKILLQKHKEKKEQQLKDRFLYKADNKENYSDLLRLPLIPSSMNYEQNSNSRKLKNKFNLIINRRHYQQDSVNDVARQKSNISKLQRSLSNNQLITKQQPNRDTTIKQNLNKSYGSDVFENIHDFLVQSINNSKQITNSKILKKQIIQKKLHKFRQKLRKMDPNQQTQLNQQSIAMLRMHSQTVSEWKKISIMEKDMHKVNTSFRQEIQKIGHYLNRTNLSLDQLLEHRKQLVDFLLHKQIKDKIQHNHRNSNQ